MVGARRGESPRRTVSTPQGANPEYARQGGHIRARSRRSVRNAGQWPVLTGPNAGVRQRDGFEQRHTIGSSALLRAPMLRIGVRAKSLIEVSMPRAVTSHSRRGCQVSARGSRKLKVGDGVEIACAEVLAITVEDGG
jgi:hypothetical protein